MSDIARLTKQEVAESPRKGFWVHAGDLNQRIEQGQLREAALQQRLTAADERVDVLDGLLREVSASCALTFEDHDATAETLDLQERIDAALKPAEGVSDDA